MRINNLKINSFGTIKGKHLNLTKGINVIKGENEAGKSTILSFVNSMLFGIDKTKRGKFISDYDKYRPWDDDEFSGSINYTLSDGSKYDVYRNFKTKNPVIMNHNKVDISKTFNVSKNGIDFLEEQIGADRNTFEKTILSPQKLVVLDKKDKTEVVQKMTNLISTGEENLSYKKIMSKLSDRQLKEVGTERSKNRPLNIIEDKIKRLKEHKKQITETASGKELKEQERKETQEQFSDLGDRKKLISEIRNRRISDRTQKVMNVYGSEEIRNKQDKIMEMKAQKKDTITKRSLWKEIKLPLIISTIIMLCLVIPSIIFNIGDYIDGINIPQFVIPSSLFGIYILFNLIVILFKRNKIKVKEETEEELNRALEKEIVNLQKEIFEYERRIHQEEQKFLDSNKSFEEKLFAKYRGKMPEKYIKSLLKMNEDRIEKLSHQIESDYNQVMFKLSQIDAEKNIINQNAEELSEIVEQLLKLEKDREELLSYSDSLDYAKELLEESYNIMKDSIGPMFNKRLSEISAKVTNNKYGEVFLNREHEVKVKMKNGEFIDLERLSDGTVEQINLALRLAVTEKISDETLPIVLDEALVFYDDNRLSSFLNFLDQEYSDGQVIILSSSDREKNMLEKLGIEANYINI